MKGSPSISAPIFLFVEAVTINIHLLFIESLNGLFDELADLSLAFDEARIPDVFLKLSLLDIFMLPIFVDDFGEIDFFDFGFIFVKPSDFVYRLICLFFFFY